LKSLNNVLFSFKINAIHHSKRKKNQKKVPKNM